MPGQCLALPGCRYMARGLIQPGSKGEKHGIGIQSTISKQKMPHQSLVSAPDGDAEDVHLREDDEMNLSLIPKKFGNSCLLVDSVRVAAVEGQPLADHPSVKYGRPPGALTMPREPLDPSTIAEAINVIFC